MSVAVKCGRCGILYHSRYPKCPRCRSSDPRPAELPRGRRPVEAAGRAPGRPQGRAASGGAPETSRSSGKGLGRGVLAAAAAAVVLMLTGWAWGPGTAAKVNAAPPPSGAPGPLAALMRAAQPRRVATTPRVPGELPFVDADAAGKLAYSNGELERALEMFREDIELHPSDAVSHSNAGQVLVRMGRPAEALPLLERAVALDENRWAYRFNLARCRGLLGDWVRAASDYREADRLFPGDYATIFNLAQALHRAGQEEEAVARYRDAIALRPGDGSFQLALGISEERLGREADAAGAYRRFLELSPGAPEAEAVRAKVEELEKAEGET